MPRRSSKEHDFVTVARRVVEQAIGEHLDGTPLESRLNETEKKTKNPHAVALGRIGGQKGGKARAEILSARKRSQIARKAAQTRWSSQNKLGL